MFFLNYIIYKTNAPVNIDRLYTSFVKLFKDKADEVMVENTILYAGIKETLSKLRDNGYKIAIVTTKFHYRIEQILN